MAHQLFKQGNHECVVFNDLVRGHDGVQANQVLLVHGSHAALFDPGGALLYTPLSLAVGQHVPLKSIDYIVASHQDPDIIGAVDRWMMYTDAKVVCSKLWGRFVPHSIPHYQKDAGSDRYLLIPDAGMRVPFGDSEFHALPAHFMHSVGNFSFFDPVSRILLSGDVGASMVDVANYAPTERFEDLRPHMEGFHKRYMASQRVVRLWTAMVRKVNPAMIVPQHGLPMIGKAIPDFLDWLDGLKCGIDLLDETDYRPLGQVAGRPV